MAVKVILNNGDLLVIKEADEFFVDGYFVSIVSEDGVLMAVVYAPQVVSYLPD